MVESVDFEDVFNFYDKKNTDLFKKLTRERLKELFTISLNLFKTYNADPDHFYDSSKDYFRWIGDVATKEITILYDGNTRSIINSYSRSE